MWEEIRAYLTFTKKERTGVLVLVSGILILVIIPYFLKRPDGKQDPAAFHTYEKAAGLLLNRPPADSIEAPQHVSAVRFHAPLFYFDPNRLSFEAWQQLGLRDQTIHTIQHFLEKGGQFRRPEDLQKIYGLGREDCERLMPFMRLPPADPARTYPQRQQPRFERRSDYSYPANGWHRPADTATRRSDYWKRQSGPAAFYQRKQFTVIDVNTADSVVWSRLPGIGIHLANRIIRFRDKLGGFADPVQVGETFGLPDSVFQSIRPFLTGSPDSVRQIDLNTAPAADLQQHPYIRWQLAKAIMRYRETHGGFKSVDELQQLVQLDSGQFRRLVPYVKAGR